MSDQNKFIILIITMIGLILLLAIFILAALYLYQKKKFELQKEIEDIKSAHEKNIRQTQLEIQEQTFQDISRDIHDNISLTLSLSKLHLNTLNYADHAELHDKINLSIHLISQAISNLNNISKSLSPDVITEYGLMKVVENEINCLKSTGLFAADYEITGKQMPLGSANELIIYRIIQEAFNNIIKHSGADIIMLRFNYMPSGLELSIEDNGIGFTEPAHGKPNSCAGLINMRKRAQLLNASFEISGEPGQGTKIRIFIPHSLN